MAVNGNVRSLHWNGVATAATCEWRGAVAWLDSYCHFCKSSESIKIIQQNGKSLVSLRFFFLFFFCYKKNELSVVLLPFIFHMTYKMYQTKSSLILFNAISAINIKLTVSMFLQKVNILCRSMTSKRNFAFSVEYILYFLFTTIVFFILCFKFSSYVIYVSIVYTIWTGRQKLYRKAQSCTYFTTLSNIFFL